VPGYIFSNPDQLTAFNIPSPHESAILARRILNLTPLGTLSTVFPSPHSFSRKDDASTLEARPQSLAGVPIGMMDYVADCESNGNPTILAIAIATTFRNAAAGSNVSLALQWTPPHPPSKRISLSAHDPVPYSAANLPRFSLLGHLESISEKDVKDGKVAECFVKAHPDAKYWLPGNRIHRSEWVRLVVDGLYWVGGFGDRAYIGWIDKEDYANVTEEEWKSARLQGEKKGWKEWAVEGLQNWEL
jgi:hypothetical protein